jgi:hypothetical protein
MFCGKPPHLRNVREANRRQPVPVAFRPRASKVRSSTASSPGLPTAALVRGCNRPCHTGY